MESAYLIVMDKDDDGGVAADLFNGVEVAHSINLVQTAVDARAGARLSRPYSTVGSALELAAAALAPLAQETVLALIALGVLVGLAIGAGTAGDVHTVADGRVDAGKAEDAATGAAGAVNPLGLASRLVAASIGNDTLDASEAAAVERGGGELELRGTGGRAHGGVDLGVAEGLFFAEVLVRPVVVVVVGVFGVGGSSRGVVGNQLVEFVLGGRGRSHMGDRTIDPLGESLQEPGRAGYIRYLTEGRGAGGCAACGRAEASKIEGRSLVGAEEV